MAPDWFDEAYYGQQKVIQMNGMNYEPEWLAAHGATQWTFSLYEQYLAAYRMPDGQPVSAWDNFLACNGANYAPGMEARQLNVSCTPLFNVEYYLQNVVDWANGQGAYSAGGIESGDWIAANMLDHILNDLGISLWEHFRTSGFANMLNPSENFDTRAYLEQRAEAMNNGSDGIQHTLDDAIAAIMAEGMNPIMDCANYGAANGLKPVAVNPEPEAPTKPAVPVPPASASSPEPAPRPDPEPAPAPNPEPEPEPDPEPTPEPDPEPEEPAPGDRLELVIAEAGNVALPAITSNGKDIYVFVDAGGDISMTSFDARGEDGQCGDIGLIVTNGNVLVGSANQGNTVIHGANIDLDLTGGEGFPWFELSAKGSIDLVGSPGDEYVRVNSLGSGNSSFATGDGKDNFELFDPSVTCAPATLAKDAQISIDLGTCEDYLSIGNLNVEGGGLQTINVNLGQDYNRETISLGSVTTGKLVLSMENCEWFDQIFHRRNLEPTSFTSEDAAINALAAFGIDAETTQILDWTAWQVSANGQDLLKTNFADAAIFANGSTYVTYGNILLELNGLAPEDDMA